MGIASDIAGDWHAALAALDWSVEAGVDEVIGESPVNRYELPSEAPRAGAAPATAGAGPAVLAAPARVGMDPVNAAQTAAEAARSLDELRAAITGFDLCDLKKGARNTVFADGNPAARVLILGEAPGADEDREGRPFVGQSGKLLDRMFAAIGLSRSSADAATALYITNALPWRPPGNRTPEPAEIAMLRPFVERHIALVDPLVIVAMGSQAMLALTGAKATLRARGTWTQAMGKPLLLMTHPEQLLRTPLAKREAWADLLALQARLRQ